MVAEQQFPLTEVEESLGYRFKNPSLLEEALTHSSLEYYSGSRLTHERLEFLGDSVLGLALSNHAFSAYPHAGPARLADVRTLNVSNEKLARLAVRLRLYRFLRRNNCPTLDEKVRMFEEAVSNEEHAVLCKGLVQAPKVLGDIVEAIAGAIYLDTGFDLEKVWAIFGGLLEPLITLDDSLPQLPPTKILKNLCTKMHKEVKFEHSNEDSKYVCNIYIDGKLFVSGSSERKEIAKLNAAKLAIFELCKSMPPDDGLTEINGSVEIECAKQKLQKLCHMKKWPKPSYSIEKKEEEGPAHEKVYAASVKIQTGTDVLFIVGGKKHKKRYARNSAASLMIRTLQKSCYFSTHIKV